MHTIRLAACAAAVAATLVNASRAEAPPSAPAEAFAVLPDKAPSLSPDGKHVAFIREENGRPVVAIYDTEFKAPPIVLKSSELLVDGILWVKNDVLVIYSKFNKKLGVWDSGNSVRGLGTATAVSISDKKQVGLSAYMNIEDIDLDDPDIIYVSYANCIYRVNVRTGSKNHLAYVGWNDESGGTLKWYFDGHGKPVARVDYQVVPPYDERHETRTLKVYQDGDWRPVATYQATIDRGDGVAGLSEDGLSVIRRNGTGEGTASITRVSLKDGSETVLTHDPVYDSYSIIGDEWTGRITGVALQRDDWQAMFLDARNQALQNGIEQAFKGLSAKIASVDQAQDKVIVAVEGPRTPTSYYLLDRTTHRAISIVATYPALSENMLGEMKPYPYKARDGLDIHAYLTLPPGREAKNLPLIVMPHGGPDLRDGLGFDWWPQFYANRGYAVLQPNYRGSSGYGRAFTEAGLHEWGLKMQDDISDGVRKLAADGIADPKRVCIVGASYGGYAALAGAAFSPELYACGVSFGGVSHLPDMLGYYKLQYGAKITSDSWWGTRIGDAFRDEDKLKATSPALHAERIVAPVMLLHSELDVTVPIIQSELMETALKKNGKAVELIRMEGDDHYLSLATTRLRLLTETERFIKAAIGN